MRLARARYFVSEVLYSIRFYEFAKLSSELHSELLLNYGNLYKKIRHILRLVFPNYLIQGLLKVSINYVETISDILTRRHQSQIN